MTSAYLDLQAVDSGTVTAETTPHEQTLRIVNPRPYTAVAVLAIPLARYENVRTRVVTADAGVTGSSNGTGAITHTLTIPAKKGVTYALSSTYTAAIDSNSAALAVATTTAIATLTVTTYNGVAVSPNEVSRFALQSACLGDIDDLRLGDGTNRRWNERQFIEQVFLPPDGINGAKAQEWADFFEQGGRGFDAFKALYEWALTQGFLGV